MSPTTANILKAAVGSMLALGVLVLMWLAMQTSVEPPASASAAAPIASAEVAPRPRSRNTARAPQAPAPLPQPDRLSREELLELVGDTDILVDDDLPSLFDDTGMPDANAQTHMAFAEMSMATKDYLRAKRHFAEVAKQEGDSQLGQIAQYRVTQAQWHLGDSSEAIAGLRELISSGQEGGLSPKILEVAESDLQDYLGAMP